LNKFAVRTAVRIQDGLRSKDPNALPAIRESILGWVAQNATISGAVFTAVELLLSLERTSPKGCGTPPDDDPDETFGLGELLSAEDEEPPWVESL
tara:strand:- start:560 stop:844 length:285 start_codon:yes stop_codon:yes gene_type:complete